jgi:hypothetical protein
MSKYQFANATIGVGTYAGEAARPYVAAAILSADTIANNYVSVLQNVHSKAVLRKFSGAAIQANDDCAFSTTTGQLTLGEAVLTATALKVNEQVCNEDLRATWEGMQMNGQNSSAPADFTTYVAQYVAAKVAENVEINLWGGKFDPTDSSLSGGGILGDAFEGLWNHIVTAEASLGYDAEVAGAFTADADATTGILTHLQDVVNNAPSEVQSDAQAVIYMSRKSLFLLQRAMAGTSIFQANDTDTTGYAAAAYSPTFVGEARPLTYMGFPIVAASGCPNDTVLFCNPNQLYFGTDLLTDHVNASILNLRDVTGDDVTRIIMQFSGGTQIVDAGSLAVARRTS